MTQQSRHDAYRRELSDAFEPVTEVVENIVGGATSFHRGYSGSGRLDIWVYRTQADALRAGAVLAMECSLDEDPRCTELFAAGRWASVLERCEELRSEDHLLWVQAAFLQPDEHGSDHH